MGKILIVDDTLFMRTLLKNILFSGGHVIAGEAGDGEEALSLIERLQPDVAILDIRLPKLSGIEVVRTASNSRSPAARPGKQPGLRKSW